MGQIWPTGHSSSAPALECSGLVRELWGPTATTGIQHNRGSLDKILNSSVSLGKLITPTMWTMMVPLSWDSFED